MREELPQDTLKCTSPAKPDWTVAPASRILIATGMHRSGTSMLMRVLNLLGVEIGDHLVPPLPNDNEAGFWEHEHLVELNEDLLEHFGGGHLSLADLPEDYAEYAYVQRLREKIWGILRRDFAKLPCWGVKDPRIARLMPFWQGIFRELNAAPSWVISVRHPAEVAGSLEKRNGISRERGLLLWLKYNLEAERNTRGLKRAFVHYPDLMADWETSLRHVAKHTGIAWPKNYTEVEAQVASFIRPELKHQQAGNMAALSPWISRTYEALKAACQGSGEADTEALDGVWREFSVFNTPMQEEISSFRKAQARQTADIEELQRHQSIILNSTSWRVTAPLRGVKCAARAVLKGKVQHGS